MDECMSTGDETCDGTDEDCDGAVDEGLPTTLSFYVDDDADGYGVEPAVSACGPRPGLAERSRDCDDTNPEVNPGAAEVCNQMDDDCDGTIDNGLLRVTEPEPSGLQGISAFETLLPYEDGFFLLFFDSLTRQAQYALLDAEGAVTAGPLRVAPVVVRDFLLHAAAIDAERIAVGFPVQVEDGVFDFQVAILNPGNPTENVDPVTVLPGLNGVPLMVVAADRVVALESPVPSQPADQPARLASIGFDLTSPTSPIDVPRAGERFSIAGDAEATKAYLVRGGDETGIAPVDPTTLLVGDFVSGLQGVRLLSDGPVRGVAVDSRAATYEVSWIDSITDEGGTATGVVDTTTDIPVEDGGLSLAEAGGQFAMMTCFASGPDSGECRYQLLQPRAAEPLTEALPIIFPDASPGEGYAFAHVARRDGHFAGIVSGGDLASPDSVPELYFFTIECPAP